MDTFPWICLWVSVRGVVMRRKLITKLLVMAISLALILQPVTPALADLNTEMTNMFNQWGMSNNTTNPGAYKGQTRGYYTGGRVTAVAPTKTLTPFAGKAPSISAGCGGIDIFGGSMTLINSSQFTAFLEAVGQNALGYAFSMGLEAVCPTCNAGIKYMKDKMDQMNAFTLNSCNAAKAMVNSVADRTMGDETEKCKASWNPDDPEAGALGCISGKSPQDILDRNKDQDPHQYKSTGQQAMEKNADLTLLQKQYAISLVGTWWLDSFSVSCSHQPPTIGLEKLMKGGDLTLIKCGTGNLGDPLDPCEGITTENSLGVKGQQENVKDQLTGILDSIKNGTPLTTTQLTFVESVTVVPIMSLLMSLNQSNSEGLQNAVIDYMSDMIALVITNVYVSTYVRIMEFEQPNITACGAHKADMQQALYSVKEDLAKEVNAYSTVFDNHVKMISFITDLNKSIGKTASANINRALAYGM